MSNGMRDRHVTYIRCGHVALRIHYKDSIIWYTLRSSNEKKTFLSSTSGRPSCHSAGLMRINRCSFQLSSAHTGGLAWSYAVPFF